MLTRIFHVSLAILLAISITGTGYFGIVKLTQNPCSTTKTWSLGPIDPRFGVSSDTIKLYSEQAAQTWNKAYEANELLRYTEQGGDIEITFIYDERQRTTIQSERLKQTIEEEKGQLEDLKRTLQSLKEEYASLEQSIEIKTKSYTSHLADHNSEVAYWNKRGGAPTNEYQRLERERAELETERTALNASINRYNQLATRIKNYGYDHNEIVDTLNEKIQTLNETALGEFEEGTYDPATRTITIYEFDDATSLKRVLAHEFGHAVGLKHVDDKESIMYSINQGENLDLTPADRSELDRICRDKTKEDIIEMVKTTRDGISRLLLSSLPGTAVRSE